MHARGACHVLIDDLEHRSRCFLFRSPELRADIAIESCCRKLRQQLHATASKPCRIEKPGSYIGVRYRGPIPTKTVASRAGMRPGAFGADGYPPDLVDRADRT